MISFSVLRMVFRALYRKVKLKLIHPETAERGEWWYKYKKVSLQLQNPTLLPFLQPCHFLQFLFSKTLHPFLTLLTEFQTRKISLISCKLIQMLRLFFRDLCAVFVETVISCLGHLLELKKVDLISTSEGFDKKNLPQLLVNLCCQMWTIDTLTIPDQTVLF